MDKQSEAEDIAHAFGLQMIALTCGPGSGSSVFQAFLDGHPEIMMIPGYPLMYLYPHWFQWLEEDKCNSWGSVIDALLYNHPSILDTRTMPGSDTLNCLGENQDEWLFIDQALFRKHLLAAVSDKVINSKNLVLGLHYAYAAACEEDIQTKKVIVYHIHHPVYVDLYLTYDFPGAKLISMIRDPRANVERRVENSVFKPDLTKLRVSDYIIHRKRAYRVIDRIVLDGLDVTKNIPLERYRVVRHEDLHLRLHQVMDATADFMGVVRSSILYDTTFGNKVWRTTYYDIDKKYLVNPQVVSKDWMKTLSFREWYVIEGLNFELIEKYYLPLNKFMPGSVVGMFLLVLLICVPSPREVGELFRLLNYRIFNEYMEAVLEESHSLDRLRDYSHNAYYRHKWMNRGLNLYRESWCVRYLRLSLQDPENRIRLQSAKVVYVVYNFLRYIWNFLVYPKEIFIRVSFSFVVVYRSFKKLRVIPDDL